MRKAGGVSAKSAEVTIELMSPVTCADAAADCIATASPGRRVWGMNREKISMASRDNEAVPFLYGIQWLTACHQLFFTESALTCIEAGSICRSVPFPLL